MATVISAQRSLGSLPGQPQLQEGGRAGRWRWSQAHSRGPQPVPSEARQAPPGPEWRGGCYSAHCGPQSSIQVGQDNRHLPEAKKPCLWTASLQFPLWGRREADSSSSRDAGWRAG